MEWLPGTVCVRAAGEAVTLKGIRRHIAVERQVPREQSHFTGYWRRTEPAPGAAEDAVPEDEEAHERLHELTDLAPGFAIRTAVTLGLFDLVRGEAAALPGRDAAPGRADPARRPGRHRRNAPTPAAGLPVRLGAPLAGRAERPGGPGRPAGAPM
ncbi:hypothetical protein Smic_02510 [Streptomyces microflavus]|uniref:SIP-like Rossmann fold domain-containing protein n=1 Tax=Streptomyces microflavus TaxID=1919 RepID=A0A7J0CIT4_STRMI|nr:hypothetical protein Smic_02510 [Streptomyces microflavus]